MADVSSSLVLKYESFKGAVTVSEQKQYYSLNLELPVIAL